MKKVKVVLVGLMILGFTGISNASTQGNGDSKNCNGVNYPNEAFQDNIEGKVLVEFFVIEGEVQSVSVIRKVSPSLDDAAVRLVNGFSSDYLAELTKDGKERFRIPVSFEII